MTDTRWALKQDHTAARRTVDAMRLRLAEAERGASEATTERERRMYMREALTAENLLDQALASLSARARDLEEFKNPKKKEFWE